MGQKEANTIGSPKRGFMQEKDSKRITRKQLKSKHSSWQRLPKKRKDVVSVISYTSAIENNTEVQPRDWASHTL